MLQKLTKMSSKLGILMVASSTMLPISCSKQSGAGDKPSPQVTTREAEVPGVMIPSGMIPRPSGNSNEIAYLGGIITTQVIGGKVYVPIQGTFSENSFTAVMESASTQGLSAAESKALLAQEVGVTLKAIGSKVQVLQSEVVPEVGYFSALIPLDDYPLLSQVTGLSHRLLINPVVDMARDPESRVLAPAAGVPLGVYSDKNVDGRTDNASFSGLERIGVDPFLKLVKEELGQDVDGAKVQVGVTDTGITLNHPAFLDAKGENRVVYMKDFTGEGQMYFTDKASFSVREPVASELPAGVDINDALILNAKFILTPVGRAVPVADKFSDVNDQLIQVSRSLRQKLLVAGSGARLSALSEKAFSAADGKENVDINHNGKSDDLLLAIILPDADVTKSKIYLDISGRGDFRKSPELGDWNATKTSMKVFSETIGFDLKTVKLTDSHNAEVVAIAAALVGYDPGNHGSHVSGIIGARKTIANDADNTKARGVAPNTKLMMDRVCSNNAGCNASSAVVDLALNGAEVVNMSLGGLSPFNDGYGVQETLINRLTVLKNVLFVISAGNSGPGRQTVGSPSVSRHALSVAATATRKMVERQYQYPGSGKTKNADLKDEDFVLFFSSRGPTAAGGMKPNISAPGTELSAVQLNSAVGARGGLDVYWGTSMAAPTATGAVALLLDAAKRYNEKFPDKKLPIDALTLSRVLTASARPFDVNSYNPQTNKRSLGQYTWIDEGNGMIDLVAAWKSLKLERDRTPASAVQIVEGDRKKSVALDYEVRVLRTSPNGIDYSGTQLVPIDSSGAMEPRFGRGIYLDINGADSLIGVQIARRLPLAAAAQADLGDLNRQLLTTADRFVLETTMYGSDQKWLKAGVLEQLDCVGSAVHPELTIIGAGAIDNPAAVPPATRSTPLGASQLQVCVNRELIKALPAGDHGALIKAYRVVDGRREAHASFVVPVYLTVPHTTLAGQAGYAVQGSAKSFAVNRHYVQIPAGTSLVKVTLEVPEAKVVGNVVSGCSGVELMALEGGNTATIPEISPRAKARVSNCDRNGATPTKRSLSFSRFNPKVGIWDLHVFGQYNYTESPYTLKVEFAKVDSSLKAIKGKTEALNGSLEFSILESSLNATPSSVKSTYVLSGLSQTQEVAIANGQQLIVPNADGVVARQYDGDVSSVTFTTGGLPGSDLDMVVGECEDADLKKCVPVGKSEGATDEEKVTIAPKKDKFYAPLVVGFEVEGLLANFTFGETKRLAKSEAGVLKVEELSEAKFKIDYAFDLAASSVLKSADFIGGKWSAVGDLTLNTEEGSGLLRLPVSVSF